MKTITKTQLFTGLLLVGYVWWEWIFLADWKAETAGPLIRIDLIVLLPILLFLIVLSGWQFYQRRK